MAHNAAMTHTDIIKAYGNKAIMAATGAPDRRVRAWRERGSIPSWYWPAIVAAGYATLDSLANGRTTQIASARLSHAPVGPVERSSLPARYQ
jgi:hypothetical protein